MKLNRPLSFQLCLIFVPLLVIPAVGLAQAKPGDEKVRKCLEDYMSGVGERVELAFHPSATMKYIDAKTGEFKDVPIADYIARVKANPAPQRKIGIVYLNREGNAAQAEIKIETGRVILYDYMNLLEIKGEWKIVSKIFTRKEAN